MFFYYSVHIFDKTILIVFKVIQMLLTLDFNIAYSFDPLYKCIFYLRYV